MNPKDWLLPIVSVALGVASLVTDSKKNNRINYLLVAMLVGAGLITVLVNAADARKTHAEQTKADQRIDQLIHGNNALIEDSRHNVSTGDTILNWLRLSGLAKSVADVVETSLQAGPARNKVLSEVRAESTPRPRVVYFPKDVDTPTVIRNLQEAHFTVDTRNAKLTEITTNKIWIGDSVSDADAKLVALTLVQAGVKIKAIRHFLDGTRSKANLIEVGASAKLANAPALTVDQIKGLSNIPRDIN